MAKLSEDTDRIDVKMNCHYHIDHHSRIKRLEDEMDTIESKLTNAVEGTKKDLWSAITTLQNDIKKLVGQIGIIMGGAVAIQFILMYFKG